MVDVLAHVDRLVPDIGDVNREERQTPFERDVPGMRARAPAGIQARRGHADRVRQPDAAAAGVRPLDERQPLVERAEPAELRLRRRRVEVGIDREGIGGVAAEVLRPRPRLERQAVTAAHDRVVVDPQTPPIRGAN